MHITYKNNKIKKICTDATTATKIHGSRMADIIHQRIDEITSSESVEFMLKFRIGRCHELEGNRKDQYAVDLVHPYRLVFNKQENEIQIAHILEIVDYH